MQSIEPVCQPVLDAEEKVDGWVEVRSKNFWYAVAQWSDRTIIYCIFQRARRKNFGHFHQKEMTNI